MRLMALVESVDHVCCRYRLAAFRPHFHQAGHQLELRPFPRSWWAWLQLRKELGRAEAVIVQRRLLGRWQLALVRRAAGRLVYDFDDALFLRDSYHRRGLHSLRRRRLFEALVRAADAVTAGNRFLAEEAARAAEGARVHVIPTCVDPAAYYQAKHTRTGPGTRLVWIGSASTMQGLASARPLLEQVARSCPGLCLKLICDRFLTLQHMAVLNCLWDEVHEAAELATADIGISWLPDDLWSRGKCGLKILQYMAAGLPVVANPVGVHAELVRHGKTGFLAQTTEQWAEAVGRLARDPELRRRLGQAGRRRVAAEFGIAGGAARWLTLLAGWQEHRGAA